MRAATVIPPSEDLFRTVESDWVDGSAVLWHAIDGEGTSCYRSSVIKTPEAASDHAKSRRPAENGVVATTPAQLPLDFTAVCNGLKYDAFAVDLPQEGHEAHCEIRWRREADRPQTSHFKGIGNGAKKELKLAIAKQMRVLIPPTPLPATEPPT